MGGNILMILVIKKKWLLIALALLIACTILILGYQRIVKTSSTISLNKLIIIDAGHGGIDGGTVGISGVVESHINLKIALKLRELLEESGAIVFMTRDQDKGLYSDSGTVRQKKNEDLRNRKKIMDESNADLFVSIHLNSFSQQQYFGAQTFYPSNSEDSKKAAEYVQEELIKVINNGNQRVAKEKSDVYLLQGCSVPTILVECGFLSNPQEEKLLQKSSYQNKIALSIYLGIMRYFNEENQPSAVFNE